MLLQYILYWSPDIAMPKRTMYIISKIGNYKYFFFLLLSKTNLKIKTNTFIWRNGKPAMMKLHSWDFDATASV